MIRNHDSKQNQSHIQKLQLGRDKNTINAVCSEMKNFDTNVKTFRRMDAVLSSSTVWSKNIRNAYYFTTNDFFTKLIDCIEYSLHHGDVTCIAKICQVADLCYN